MDERDSPEKYTVMEAEAVDYVAGNRFYKVSLERITPTIGVTGAGEFVERSRGTWEAHHLLHKKKYLGYK